MTAVQKADVVLEITKKLGFALSLTGVVTHPDYIEMFSEDEQYVFRIMMDTGKIMYGRFDMKKLEYIWDTLR